MAHEPSQPPSSDRPVSIAVAADHHSFLPRLSLKTGLTVALSAGFLLFLLSQVNDLLVHSLIELASIILAVSVFLIGWNTRHLVRNRFFVILAIGFLATGLVDLLHALAYEGMNVLHAASDQTSAQLWLIARGISATSFLCAALSLGRESLSSVRGWLIGFLGSAVILCALIWPFDLFPVTHIDGVGLTPFRLVAEYIVIALLAVAAFILWMRGRHLNRHLVISLLAALGLNVLAELVFPLYRNYNGYTDFVGHYFKLMSGLLVYYALVEGTLRAPFVTLFRDMTQSYEELDLELQRRSAAEKKQQAAHREITFLYRVSRAMHRTLNLDEVAHLILTTATFAGDCGFERATLFTVNRRTGMLQGMLGVTRDALGRGPLSSEEASWDRLLPDATARETQRLSTYNQLVVKQRLPLDAEDNALARACLEGRVMLVPQPLSEPAGGRGLAKILELGPYACASLVEHEQILGVLLVDNPYSRVEITPERRHFLELFAGLAGSALSNAGLVKRLEMAHDDLRDVQEQLIQGEKLAVLGEMAAQVAHELRNPLVSIGGFAHRLSKQEPGDPRANEYAGIIAREVRRMEEMLGNILAFSKKQLVCLEPCDVNAILQEVLSLEREHCQRQKITLEFLLKSPLPEILADCRQLQQVFLNLIINARQAMAKGGTLTVRAGAGVLRGDQSVVIEVEDTGGGIAPEVMRNIFNPFFTTYPKGTGLGLSISHRIVAHHHGEIEVINGEKGARFIVSLPVVPPSMTGVDKHRAF